MPTYYALPRDGQGKMGFVVGAYLLPSLKGRGRGWVVGEGA